MIIIMRFLLVLFKLSILTSIVLMMNVPIIEAQTRPQDQTKCESGNLKGIPLGVQTALCLKDLGTNISDIEDILSSNDEFKFGSAGQDLSLDQIKQLKEKGF